MAKFKQVIPILYSSDVSKSIAYYVDKLGFEEKWEWDSPATFGGVSKDDVNIFFCEPYQGNPKTWICILVDNVDEVYQSLKSKGANIKAEPECKEWGITEMLVEDPDGNILRIGQRS